MRYLGCSRRARGEMRSRDGILHIRIRRRANIWIAVIILAMSVGATAAQPQSGEPAPQPKRVVVLYSYGQNFQAWATWGREIRSELNRQSPWPIDLQEYSITTARNGDQIAEVKFAEYLKALYAQRPPDLIIALAAPAGRFVQRYRAEMFPAVPMLLAAVSPKRIHPSMLSEQDAIAGVEFDPIVLFDNILRLLPETKTIALINGNSPNERAMVAEMPLLLGPVLQKVDLLFYGERSLADTLNAVATLPPHSAIFFQQLHVDGTGAVYGDKEPLKRISEVANAPIFTFDTSYFDGEVVGGPMFSPAEGARPTAAAAVRLLGGEKGIKAPLVGFAAPKYDWRQLKRWRISESLLPHGSVVVNREPTVWDTYRWQLVTIIITLLLQGALILLLLERHRRQAAELASQQRMVELAHVNRFSTAGEMAASIAHEINQPLGAILNNTETAKILLGSQSPDLKLIEEIVHDIQRDNGRATDVVRTLRSFIKKVPFKKNAIDVNDQVAKTLKFLAPEARSREVSLGSKLNGAPLRINGDAIQLQQVLSNLILNGFDATSEAQSEKAVTVATRRNGRFAEISVADTGPGVSEEAAKKIFDPFFSTKDHGMGMGLSIVRTIVEAHNGHIEVENRNGAQGAVFRVNLPLA